MTKSSAPIELKSNGLASIAIIICTRNRADSLRATLKSISACRIPNNFSVELIVVDNGSSDHTLKVVEQAKDNFSNVTLRCLIEPKPGQARARNLAIQNTDADLLLWTDDDVLVPVDWVEQMCKPLLSGCADAVMGGVRLAESLKRDWLTPLMSSWLATTDCYKSERPTLVGANMIFSSKILEKVSGFCEDLGPGALGFRDDTEFAGRVNLYGFRIVDGRCCEVEHWPGEKRLTRQSLLKSADSHGRSIAYDADWIAMRHRILALPMFCLLYARSWWESLKASCKYAPVSDKELLMRKNASMWREIHRKNWTQISHTP
ncbi:glycosyl transferase family 2 [Rhodopirellula maiorica SM1]|uniref:Glycosyl transferase family 2 n=1 Tax=Rhodopirellula maiorica SM1 TaxID=1265738 RepID=M5R7X0_9BACT|nr:glycosyltransferase family A protein [Rhodopirellula maiorica]EMI15583.1 glycosyl transferase family 2 [Rhodopirellula maiorica SM1]